MGDPEPAEPRIAPGGVRQVGLRTWLLSQGAGVLTGTAPPNLFLTLGRHRRLFRGWLRFAARLMPRGSLPRRETELVILRVAHLRGCDYELRQHSRLARRAGVSQDEIHRVVTSDRIDERGWSGREHAMLTAVDRLHHHRDLDDATWTLLRRHLTEPECIELCMLAAHYDMLATVIAALRVRPDRPRGHRPRASSSSRA